MRCRRGQSAVAAASEDLARGLVVGGEGRDLVVGVGVARLHAGQQRGPVAVGGLDRGQHLGQGGVDLGRGAAEGARPVAEVLAAGQRLAGDAPGVLDARQELLGEREVPDGEAAGEPLVRPLPGHVPERARHEVRPAEGECRLHDHVGVLAVVQDPEDLADQRLCATVTARGVVDDRGVGLLAAQHPGRPDRQVGAARLPVTLRVGAAVVTGGGHGRLGQHALQQHLREGRVARPVVDVERAEGVVLDGRRRARRRPRAAGPSR